MSFVLFRAICIAEFFGPNPNPNPNPNCNPIPLGGGGIGIRSLNFDPQLPKSRGPLNPNFVFLETAYEDVRVT